MNFIHLLNECPIAYVELSSWGTQWTGVYGYELYGLYGEIVSFLTYEDAALYRRIEIKTHINNALPDVKVIAGHSYDAR